MGIHLALVDGTPTLPPRRVPTLVEDDGRFRSSWKPFIVACLRGKVSLAQVELELVAHRAPVVDAHVERMTAEAMRVAPLASERFRDALPLIPGVVRDPRDYQGNLASANYGGFATASRERFAGNGYSSSEYEYEDESARHQVIAPHRTR